ncbi:Os01g0838350, partial [Oryza sativa Japonica Group]
EDPSSGFLSTPNNGLTPLPCMQPMQCSHYFSASPVVLKMMPQRPMQRRYPLGRC